MQRLLPIPVWHRAYVRSHLIGLTVAFGVFLGGLIGLIAPDLVHESAPSLVLPDWILVFFNVIWVIGGGLASFGLIRGSRDVEIPGMILMAGGLASYYAIIASIRATSALAALFILLLAIGFVGHAINLWRFGYDDGRPK